MSTTFSLVAPIGLGNWPAAAALVNLNQRERREYATCLDLMNLLEQINLSVPGYRSATDMGRNRWDQILTLYNAQRATIGRQRQAKTKASLRSMWWHSRRDMLLLIDRNSGLGVPVQPPAPGPVVSHQQQHISLPQQPHRTPLPASRPNTAIQVFNNGGEEGAEDDEMEVVEEEEDDDEVDGGEEADIRLLAVFGFGGI